MRSKIKSDKPSFDGYEVTNLLSGDYSLKNKGFLSDHFVKPPVNVTVEFPCNIAVYRIVINPVIGRQQSCELKLFSGTKIIKKSWLYGNEDNAPVNTSGLLMNRIGFISANEPTSVFFQNSYFKARGIWTINTTEDSLNGLIRSELFAHKSGSLCNVSHLNICVSRIKSGAGTAAIKQLEVWGMPANSVSFDHQQQLFDVYKKAVFPGVERTFVEKTECDNSEENVFAKEAGEYIIENGVQIPDDFIDQITFEIMTMPMLLPCGKNIDQSTLEKFVNTEASWGRAPSDPFTGVLFSPGHQVVPNTALKARLDQFLLRYSDKLKVARTLGSAGTVPINRTMKGSRLVTASGSSMEDDKVPIPSKSAVKRSGKNEAETMIFNNKKRKLNINFHDSNNPVVKAKRNSFTAIPKSVTETGDLNISSDNISESNVKIIDKVTEQNPVKHTSALNSSLDSALSSVLSTLPSFTSSREDTRQGFKAMSCSSCSKDLLGDTIVKYKLPCNHYICRKCVQFNTKSMIECKICDSKFTSVQLTRVF